MPRDEKLLVLIDGHGLAYRMYFAMQNTHFSTREGEPTNATYGFTRVLLNLMNDPEPPDYLAVSFDVGRTFRDDLFEDYKGTREKMPDDLQRQIDRIHEVLVAFNIPVLEIEGFEADDVLGTVARLAGAEPNLHTLIVTGDRDLLQLVDERTTVQLPDRKGGDERFNAAGVIEKMGVRPDQVVDYKALAGDTSDNIPGVKGIGEKTAISLLQTYDSLDGIYANLKTLKPPGVRAKLETGRDNAYLSQQLARIRTDVPLELDLEHCRVEGMDRPRVLDLFRQLEFRTLIKLLPGGEGEEANGSEAASTAVQGQQLAMFGGMEASADVDIVTEVEIVRTQAQLEAMCAVLAASQGFAVDTETTSLDQMQAEMVGISLSCEAAKAYYIPLLHRLDEGEQLALETVVQHLGPLLGSADIPKFGHNLKYDAAILERHGMPVKPASFDTMLAAWLLRPDGTQGKLGLKSMAWSRLGVQMAEISTLIGSGKRQITMDLVEVERAAPYAGADADMTYRLVEVLKEDLATEPDITELLYQIEMPLVPVLMRMEMAGILVDTDLLSQLSFEARQIIAEKADEIYKIAGYPFNINSTQQLSEVLFGKLGISSAGMRKTKGGAISTAAYQLEDLREQDKTGIIDLLMQYRELEKLRSTYLEALPQMINPHTGRIHTSFNQVGVVTGRLSSSDPNLQNIPIRTEQGRRIRDAFIAAPGHVLIGADYSQVELRILAHVSEDEALTEAFLQDQDIHAATAATVYGVPIDKVDIAQRSFAKRVNFGLLYGMGAFRLARDAGLSMGEAEQFIKTYFERFPKVRGYLDGTKQMAVEKGYVETLLKRRRYFPILQSDERGAQAATRRRAAEREAINMPIQGTAADIIKIAMIRLDEILRQRALGARMLLQVHDELLVEARAEHAEEVTELVRSTMQDAYPLNVPLRVDARYGPNWGALK